MTQWFVYIPAGFFFSRWNFEVNFRWNFAVNPFRFFGKISTWKKIPGGKICIFHLILLLYIAFHLYSISCEGEKNPPVFFYDSMCYNSPGFRLDLFVQECGSQVAISTSCSTTIINQQQSIWDIYIMDT